MGEVVDPTIEPDVVGDGNDQGGEVIIPDYDADKDMADAQARYRSRLEELGGKFNDQGEFLGFDIGGSDKAGSGRAASSVETGDNDDDGVTKQLSEFRRELTQDFKPDRIDRVLEQAIKAHPELETYRSVAQSMLDKIDGSQINNALATSVLYMARGQAADVEIAKVRKEERIKAGTKIDAGAAAASEGAGAASKATGASVEISDQVKEYAKAWGLDPKMLAEKLTTSQKGRN